MDFVSSNQPIKLTVLVRAMPEISSHTMKIDLLYLKFKLFSLPVILICFSGWIIFIKNISYFVCKSIPAHRGPLNAIVTTQFEIVQQLVFVYES